jgi:hypothetical protein
VGEPHFSLGLEMEQCLEFFTPGRFGHYPGHVWTLPGTLHALEHPHKHITQHILDEEK